MVTRSYWGRHASVARALAGLLALVPTAAIAQGVPSNAVASSAGFRGTQSARPGEAADERRWDATLRAFASYDSNIGLTEEDAPPPYEYEPGLRSGVAASASFRFVDTGRIQLGAGMFLAQTITAGDKYADEYDLSTVSPQLFAGIAFDVAGAPGSLQLSYQFRRDFLEGADFESSHSVRMSASVRPFAFLEASASYQVSLDEFDASGFHSLDATRDADTHRFALQATWLRTESGQSLSIGYENLRNLAESANRDFEGNGAFARFRTPLPFARPVRFELLAAYTGVDYVHYTPAPRREARTQLYQAALLLPLSPHFLLDASYAFTRIGADQGRFRSERHVISAGVSYHF